jgi:hypothetical protein
VNAKTLDALEFEEEAAQMLECLLKSVPWLKGACVTRNPATDQRIFDIAATLSVPGGSKVVLQVECKRNPRPSLLPHVAGEQHFDAERRRHNLIPVLAAPYVAPRLAEVCSERGWNWFDLAGNCHLNIPNVIYIERAGHRPLKPLPGRKANLGTAEASRLIRVLLATENLGRQWTQRELQHDAQPVSLGLVNKVVRRLADDAFVESCSGDGGICLRDPSGLLSAWNQAYRFDRHRRHGYFTLLQGRRLQDRLTELEALTGGQAAYAAFSAADIQAPHVRQPKTWLYIGAEHLKEFGSLAEAKPVDTGENLVVLVPEDDGVFLCGDTSENRLGCTMLAQTYADLKHCGGRGVEAADALLEQRLKPAWKLAGLER